MTSLTTINLLRLLFALAAILIGGMIGEESWWQSFPAGAALGLVFSLLLVLGDRLLKGLTLRAFSSATFGLLLGLLFATLLRASGVLNFQPVDVQWIISLLLYAGMGYLGMMLAMRSNRDEFSLLIPYVRFARKETQEQPLLVDTNILIEGRIAEVCATGFLSGALVVPRFILEELQALGDSSDALKRERGRRGFDNIERMRRHCGMAVTIHDSIPDPDLPTDTRLINLARLLGCRLVSNDMTLARVARLQGVTILNLNELARALRPTLASGDEIDLALVKEGREPHQALGYTPDGTMIVVNNGRPALGRTVPVVIASTVQTASGRLFFAELKV